MKLILLFLFFNLLLVSVKSHAKSALSEQDISASDSNNRLACGDYTLNAWVKLIDGEAYLVVVPGSQSEIKFRLRPERAFEVLTFENHPVHARVTLIDNVENQINVQGKKWFESRIVDFRRESKLSELIRLKKSSKCQKNTKAN